MKRDHKKKSGEGSLRKTAEKQLARNSGNRSASELDSPTKIESERMFHELQVHQIELELQNEELRGTKLQLEDAIIRYDDFYDIAPISYFTFNKSGKILEANLTGSTLLNAGRTEILGTHFSKYISADSRVIFNQVMTRVFTENIKASCLINIPTLHEGIIWAHITLSAPVEGTKCLAVVSDVTDLKKTETDLGMSQRKLNLALDNGNIGIWEYDLELKRLTLDDRTKRMLDTESTFTGESFSTIENYIHEEDILHFREAVRRMLENEGRFESVFRVRRADQGSKYLVAKGMRYRDVDNTEKIMGVVIDISEMKKGSEAALIRLNEELMRSNKDLEQFAYIASHDLQEPLRMVSSFTQMLAEKYGDKLDDRAHEYVSYAVEGAKRMYDLINGLLAYSRIQTKGEDFLEIDIENVLREVLRNLSLLIEKKEVRFDIRDMPVIRADRNQMVQLFQNLISNSIKFSKDIPIITINAEVREHDYLFTVSDNGIGIDPQYHDRIFQIFQRLFPRDAYEGTGIGLSICKRIVERHGGSIWVHSVPDKGSSFYFTISK